MVVDGTKMTLTLSFFHIKQQSSHALNQSDLFFFVFFFFFPARKLSYLLDQHGNDGDKDGTFVAVSREN